MTLTDKEYIEKKKSEYAAQGLKIESEEIVIRKRHKNYTDAIIAIAISWGIIAPWFAFGIGLVVGLS